MSQTASLTCGTFIQRVANLFRAAWAPCVKKYAWKILGERENFNFTFTSTKYLSRYYVGRLQTNVSLLAKQHPPEDYAEIPQSFFFPLLDAYCVCEKKNLLGHCRRRRCCKKLSPVVTERWAAASLLSREGKPTLVPHIRFWINDYLRAREKYVMKND